MLPTLGDRRVDGITAADVADLVAALAAKAEARDGPQDPARRRDGPRLRRSDRGQPVPRQVTVRLPREQKPEIVPPTAEHVQAVHDLLPSRYRLPLLVLDATGMRLGELEGLAWGDVDEQRGRWRVSQAVAKTGQGRWVQRAAGRLRGRAGARARARIAPPSASFPGVRRRPLPHRDHARLHRGRRARVLAARPPPPPDLAAAPAAACRGRGSASTSASGTSP